MDAPQWPKVSEHGFHKETSLIKLAEGSVDVSVSNSSSSHLKNKKTRPNKDQALNCPRCNSTNTKFCYYNNYNPSQPRHLCKACRRYWTQGGTLRNVPLGGTSRKKINKPSLARNFQSRHNTLLLDLNPKPTTIMSLSQDLNMGLYYANAQHHFLPNSSLFELSHSQGALSPYHNNASMVSLEFNFQDIVKPTLNLSMDGGFGSTNHDRRNMEGGVRNPYLFGEVKQVSATTGEENVINQPDGQMRVRK